jgi:hypothetical protein
VYTAYWRSLSSAPDPLRKSYLLAASHNQAVATGNEPVTPSPSTSPPSVLQNVNAGTYPLSRHRQDLLKINFLSWWFFSWCIHSSHSVLGDCDGVAGSSSSPCNCLAIWNYFHQMLARILQARETTPEIPRCLLEIVQAHQRTSWVPHTLGMTRSSTLALHPCHPIVIFSLTISPSHR